MPSTFEKILGVIIYHTTKDAAEKSMAALPHYEQEDARVERLSK